jgi:signal transduction histidine kinase
MLKILIVEDEQLVADDLRETLEYLGYTVLSLAATGEEAIALVGIEAPDLVLMDIRLAGEMDGIEASKEIQSRFHIPVVYLTANADRATLERVKATHPFGYILKPFDEKILATTIEIAFSRHQAEVEVQKALLIAQEDKQAAELENKQKSHYLYMAAHEFRNPIAAIRMGAEILKNYSNQMTEDKKEKYFQRIEYATNSLNQILEDILTLGQAESGKLQCLPIEMDIVNFCQEQIEALQISVGNKYNLKLSVMGESQIIYLDEQLMWHLLNNLLSNATKYSPMGGVVSLTISFEDDAVYLSIKDQGIGIPTEAQSKLFEPFQRAANVGKIPGTGLGLAIVKQCVDLLGGKIECKSILGQGTSFIIQLPFVAVVK